MSEKKEQIIDFSQMDALMEQERELRREEEGKAPAEVTVSEAFSPYSYFHPDEIERNLRIQPEDRRNAERLIAEEKVRISGFARTTFDEATRHYSDVAVQPDAVVGLLSLWGMEETDYGTYPITVEMIFGQDRLLESRYDGTRFSRKYEDVPNRRRKLFLHEVAGVLLFRDYVQKHPEMDSTTPVAESMIRALEEMSGISAVAGKNYKREAVVLEPQIEVQDNAELQCTFRIGTGRLYKIRNLYRFYQLMEQGGGTMHFSTKTSQEIFRQDFTEESALWYDFIRDDMQQKEEQAGYFGNYYDTTAGDSVRLFGEKLDHFLDIAMGKTLPVSIHSYGSRCGKDSWTVRDKVLLPKLTILPDEDEKALFNGIRLCGQLPPLYIGLYSACWMDKGYLNRMDRKELRALRPIFNCCDRDGKFTARIGRYQLADFYHKALPQLQKVAQITEENAGRIASFLPPQPIFMIYLDVENDAFLCRAEAVYGREIFSLSDALHKNPGNGYAQYRDREREEALVRQILQYFPRHDGALQLFYVGREEEPAYELLAHGLDDLTGQPHCQVRMTERFRRLGLRRSVKFEVGVRLESNLLDLSVSARELSEEEMLQVLYQYQRKRRFVVLKNGDFLKLENNESLQRLIQMMEDLHLSVQEITKGKMHIPAYRALYLDKMLEGQEDFYTERDRHFKKLIKEFKTVEDADFDVPKELECILRPYQKDGYHWLRTLDHYGFGGLLADEMGLGKTLQVLAVLSAVREEEKDIEGRPHTSLVICPASLVYNWQEEARHFAPSLKTVTVTGTAAERKRRLGEAEGADLLITSYDLLKRDIAEYEDLSFRFEILDEAQYIKTHTTAAAKAVKLIHAVTKFALTGTPVENRLSELWSIFDYLMPGFLYSYDHFRSTIEVPIVKQEKEDTLERLHRMIAPFLLRRCKKEVLKDLPDKLEEVRYAGLEGKQQELYDAQVMRMRNDLKNQDESDFRRSRIQILAELMRIRQICCDPSLCYTNYDGNSAKTELCMELLRSLMDGGHKTLVFSQFTSMLEILRTRLDGEHISYYEITGSTSKEERLKLVQAFNQNEVPVFLISLKAGGTGLNLVGADSVIHYDPWWNTAAEDQASDRAHRIGQKKVVTVYKLVTKGTIEEKIVALQQQKAKLADDILSGDGAGSATLTKEELLEILQE